MADLYRYWQKAVEQHHLVNQNPCSDQNYKGIWWRVSGMRLEFQLIIKVFPTLESEGKKPALSAFASLYDGRKPTVLLPALYGSVTQTANHSMQLLCSSDSTNLKDILELQTILSYRWLKAHSPGIIVSISLDKGFPTVSIVWRNRSKMANLSLFRYQTSSGNKTFHRNTECQGF